MTSPKRVCVECGVPVPGRGRRLYCSERCAFVTRECIGCGKTFAVPRKRVGRNFACSLSCRTRETVPKVRLSCQECGKPFYRWPSQLTDTRGKYCSRHCAALGRPINGRPSAIASAAVELFLARTHLSCEPEKRLGRWSIDLAIPQLNLAIELDGEYWHSLPAMVSRDRRKDASLTAAGWTVRRITITKTDTAESVSERICQEAQRCLL